MGPDLPRAGPHRAGPTQIGDHASARGRFEPDRRGPRPPLVSGWIGAEGSMAAGLRTDAADAATSTSGRRRPKTSGRTIEYGGPSGGAPEILP